MVQRNRIRPMLKPEHRTVVRPPSVWDYIMLQVKMGDDTPYSPDDRSHVVLDLFTAMGFFIEDGSIVVVNARAVDPQTGVDWKRRACNGKMTHKVLEIY